MSKDSLLEFPCDFPIKIMGDNSTEFETEIIRIVRQHVPDLGEGAVRQNQSAKGNYLALTVTIRAQSKAQLDNLYRALSACELAKMVL
ncbi:MAG: DUF493 domain-containing protein [Gammaproteobacteria bacterium]|nr:DUF493 domain-containing protein [Gammaproteobacteria bacterium]